MTKSYLALLFGVISLTACKKDDTDTSGGQQINLERKLEVFIDGTEWESDEVVMSTIYGGMKIVGEANGSKLEFVIDEFQGAGTYFFNNVNNYMRYYESSAAEDDYYYALDDSLVITSYNSNNPFMLGSFSFEGLHSNGGADKSFTNGVLNGLDSLSNIPNDVFAVTTDGDAWLAKSVLVSQNTNAGTVTALAVSSTDNTYIVIRLPINVTAGSYPLNDPNYTVEYQFIDEETFSANSGEITITENNPVSKILRGHFEDLNTVSVISGGSISLSGSFSLEYN